MKTIILLLLSISLFFCKANAQTQGTSSLPTGEGMFVYNQYKPFDDKPIDVHYYIPTYGDITKMPIVFVFQGADRNYTYLLEAWAKEAQAKQFMVFIPQFDKDMYPLNDYQEVGVMNAELNTFKRREELTPVLIDKIYEYIAKITKHELGCYNIYGHSAGGQFVQRFMLVHNSPYIRRAVIGSPGWYTFPDTTKAYPYGVKDIPYIDQEQLKQYLQKDIVLQLATGDTVRESYLRKTPEAEAQGRNRYERGNTFYNYIQKLAASHQWRCRWRKIIVKGVGHQSIEMGMAAIPLLLQPSPKDYQTPTLVTNKDGFASLQTIEDYLSRLAKQHSEQVYLSSIGKTPEGLDIPILYFGNGSDSTKIKLWIQGGLHGNEPAGVEAICMLAAHLLHDSTANALLQQANIALIPVANPYGYQKQSRYSGSGLDLNRDQTKLTDPVTSLLKRAYLHWNPDIALDIHEFRPNRQEFAHFDEGLSAEVDYDVLFLPSGHPNIVSTLRQLTQHLFLAQAKDALQQQGYTSSCYFTPRLVNDTLYAVKAAKSPQSSSTWQGLNNAVSLFIEIKGIGMGRNLFDKRVECGFIVAYDAIRTACIHREELKRCIALANQETLENKRDITVTFQSTIHDCPIRFIGQHTGRRFTKTLPALDALLPVPTLTRRRPDAYLFHASCRKAINKLKALGIEVQTLKEPLKCQVESYQVESCNRAAEEWEQIHPIQVDTKIIHETKTFPPGSYLVPVRQKGGNLLVTLLEPESDNGFVAFNVIPAEQGKVLPYCRLINK